MSETTVDKKSKIKNFTARIGIRLEPEERIQLQKRADLMGISVSSLVKAIFANKFDRGADNE